MEREREREVGRYEGRRTKHAWIKAHCVPAKLLNDPLAETWTRLATKLKLSRLLLLPCSQEYCSDVTVFDSCTQGTLLWSTHGILLCFYIVRLTFQHFHGHLCAGLGMSETIRSCFNYSAKGSWSKSATWNTKRGSVGRNVNAAHGRHEKEKRPSVLTFTPTTDTFTFVCAASFICSVLILL